MKKVLFIFSVISIFLVGCIEEKKFEVPNLSGRVVDTTNTLSKEEISKIENAILNFEKNTGGQFAVCIVPEIPGETVESASMKVAEAWKIGNQGKDDGIIFFLTMKEREFRIEIGYGYEGKINDGKAGDIGRLAIPKFKSQKWSEGIISIIDNCSNVISGKKTEEQLKAEAEKAEEIPVWFWIVLSIIAFLVIIDVCKNGDNSLICCIFLSSDFSSGSGRSSGGFRGGGGGFGGGGFSGKF